MMNYRYLYACVSILLTLTLPQAASLTEDERAQFDAIQQRQTEQILKFRTQATYILTKLNPDISPIELRAVTQDIVLKPKCLSALSQLDELNPEGTSILLSMLILLRKNNVDFTAFYDEKDDPVKQSLRMTQSLLGIE